jgi:hypothetical protein
MYLCGNSIGTDDDDGRRRQGRTTHFKSLLLYDVTSKKLLQCHVKEYFEPPRLAPYPHLYNSVNAFEQDSQL